MKRYFLSALVLTLLFGILGRNFAQADKLSLYTNTKTLANGDRLFVVLGTNSNANINWYDLKELMSKTINWSDIPASIPSSSINWTDVNGVKPITTGLNWINQNAPASGLNWNDMRAYGTSHGGDHSGINWTAFGV